MLIESRARAITYKTFTDTKSVAKSVLREHPVQGLCGAELFHRLTVITESGTSKSCFRFMSSVMSF